MLRDARFHTTRWSLVVAAGADDAASGQALNTLCELYWYPVYAFVRRQGAEPAEAEDLTQAYFARMIEKAYLAQVDRERGRFRTFLLSSLKHFLSNERDRAQTIKRGGRATHVSLEEQYAAEASSAATPDELFERRAALAVLDAALAELKRDYEARGAVRQFDVLAPLMTGEDDSRFAKAAADLDMTPGALRVALHRMRRRFSTTLRTLVSTMVSAADQVDDELRHLLGALSQ